MIRYRAIISALANLLVIVGSYSLAFLLRFDLTLPSPERHMLVVTLPAAVVVHYAAFWFFKLTRGWWRYVGIGDFKNAVKASLAGAVGLSAYVLIIFHRREYPRSILLINGILLVGISIGVRLIVRLWREMPLDDAEGPRKRILIVGAGDTGEALLRELRQSAIMSLQVVAFVDDDHEKRGAYINGVPVVAKVSGLADACERYAIDEIIVATPSASGQEMRAIIDHCREAKKPFKVMPATWEVLTGRAGAAAAREVDINDLLRRPPVDLDVVGIAHFLRKKRVLVTGAAGSIGAEICRQVLRFEPALLVCLDHDENALFYLERALAPLKAEHDIRYRLLDITDVPHVDSLFAETKPEVVFHAAAHKHVPLIEANAVEAVKNNVFGTDAVVDAGRPPEAEAFVLSRPTRP